VSAPIKWQGKQAFYVAGTGLNDDTIRIEGSHRELKERLSLVLPTLCITYADLRFANAVGGVQADYPDSAGYGPLYFDPPVVINGEEEIRKHTWIRGADQVTIGPKETVIKWWGWRTLVIPKLRIKSKKKAKAVISVPEVVITVSQPFSLKTMQYTDGRHVGGVQLVKRHPDWKPEPVGNDYGLWVRVTDGYTKGGIPEAKVSLYTWKAGVSAGKGEFVPESYWFTNGMGIVEASGLPCSSKKLVLVDCKPWLPQVWRFRPIGGQKVRLNFKLWQNKRGVCRYEWKMGDTLDDVASLAGTDPKAILDMNKLHSEKDLKPGQLIDIPCFEAVYRFEDRDTLKRISELFCYDSVEKLAEANKLAKPYKLYKEQAVLLPSWLFFIAPPGSLFEELDKRFKLPGGWTRPAQRRLHDNPAKAYDNEVIAVPTKEFAEKHAMNKWH